MSIFGLESFLWATDTVEKMEIGKLGITSSNLKRLGNLLLQTRLSDYPYMYKVRDLEERYDALKGTLV